VALLTISTPRARALAARGFQALADETRLRILELLRDGERCVCDIQDLLGTSQSGLSFHLKTLKEAGLLLDRRQGRWVYYRLNREGLGGLEAALEGLRER
jgi:ArsR family transcriptional regulator